MKNENLRLTKTTIAVLQQLLAATDEHPAYGSEIAYRADLEVSTVSYILKRLREIGWAEGWHEDDGLHIPGPGRYYHELTPVGYENAVKALLARDRRRREQFRRFY
jgi:predicted transcriptional regulator